MKSATPAESPDENVWMNLARDRNARDAAENRRDSRSFHVFRSTGRENEDCYTFEHFARCPAVLRSTYYYHYKRTSSGLKEETKWS